VLAVVLFKAYRADSPAGSGVLAYDSKFQPLDVQEPRLHTELLDRIRKLEYSGTHRNIFVARLLLLRPSAAQTAPKPVERFVGPRLPPPPPPLQVPAEFFGYATRSASGKRVAFFTSGDDVLVVPEGDTFLGRFRLSTSATIRLTWKKSPPAATPPSSVGAAPARASRIP
jgi:hypothetical protein